MLEEIKSKYILQHIFNIICERKMLQLIKHNKNDQEKLEISEIDYRKFTQIEIEIKLLQLDKFEENKFIFINLKEDQSFYHIYFDNNKEEIKRTFVKRLERISIIKIVLEMEIKSLMGLFHDCICIQKIKIIKFNRNDIMNLSSLFDNCIGLTDIDLRELKTKNVIDMSHMFYNCSSLKQLDLSQFITKNVIDMNNMFSWCGELTEINFKNIYTEKVTNMQQMFYMCGSLTELDISNFNFDRVTTMKLMFAKCESLNNLKIPIINFNRNVDISGMFLDCTDEFKENIKAENKTIKEEAFSLQINS
jgi:surface protein